MDEGVYDYHGTAAGADTDKSEADTLYQAMALLYSVLLLDIHAKMNLAQLRQSALHSGLVDIGQVVERRYRSNKNVSEMTSSLLKVLISDLS